jgi:hypothetical protein
MQGAPDAVWQVEAASESGRRIYQKRKLKNALPSSAHPQRADIPHQGCPKSATITIGKGRDKPLYDP